MRRAGMVHNRRSRSNSSNVLGGAAGGAANPAGRGSRGLAVTAGKALHRPARGADLGRGRQRGAEAYTLTGILAPAGTPKAITDRLHREIVSPVALPDAQQRPDELGFEIVANSPPEFAARINTEREKWAHP